MANEKKPTKISVPPEDNVKTSTLGILHRMAEKRTKILDVEWFEDDHQPCLRLFFEGHVVIEWWWMELGKLVEVLLKGTDGLSTIYDMLYKDALDDQPDDRKPLWKSMLIDFRDQLKYNTSPEEVQGNMSAVSELLVDIGGTVDFTLDIDEGAAHLVVEGISPEVTKLVHEMVDQGPNIYYVDAK